MNLKLPLLLGCCLFAAITACAETSASLDENAAGKKKADVYITTADRQQSFNHTTQKLSKTPAFESVITLNSKVKFQEMDGFGAAVTGSTCYNLMQMTPADRAKFLTETFSDKDGLGFSYIRISIGCSDFSLSEYTCCDTKGIENFALQTEEKEYVIPILKDILAINPTIKILGSPWTCPKWMKVNNLEEKKPFDSWTSGQLNPDYYQDYATYFVKWIEAFRNEGIDIYSVTLQNEPLNRGNSASLFMGWKEELAFVRDALGPAFKAAGLDTKIYAFDHNYNYDNMADQQQYPVKMYDDEVAAAFLTGAAYHNYGGRREELNNIRQKRPDKELIFTETSIGMWNDGRNLEKRLMEDMREVALGTVNNWCKCVIVHKHIWICTRVKRPCRIVKFITVNKIMDFIHPYMWIFAKIIVIPVKKSFSPVSIFTHKYRSFIYKTLYGFFNRIIFRLHWINVCVIDYTVTRFIL